MAACDCEPGYFRQNTSQESCLGGSHRTIQRQKVSATKARIGPVEEVRALLETLGKVAFREDRSLLNNHGVCEPCPFGALCGLDGDASPASIRLFGSNLGWQA